MKHDDPADPMKDPRNRGDNGNPAQSAARPTALSQNESPEVPGEDPDLFPEKAAKETRPPKADTPAVREGHSP